MPNRFRCVLDTNILISAVLSTKGKPYHALLAVIEQGYLLASQATFEELRTRLVRPKFAKYISDEERKEYLEFIEAQSVFIDVVEAITDCPDPDDNKILELAVSGEADYIVSGDRKHLLPMHPYRGIPIVSASIFLELNSSD